MSEKYEFAAMKSSGISLQRVMRPLLVVTLLLSLLNFTFLNNIFPYATLKQLNLRINIKQKQPTLALIAGSFNTEIPNFQIKFDRKYGEKSNLLDKVIIYDISARHGNNKIITADKGEIVSEKGSRYMTLVLKDGYFFENYVSYQATRGKKMPASSASFDEYTINIDISELLEGDLNEEKYTNNYNMLNIIQLKDTLPIMQKDYRSYITTRSNSLITDVDGKNLYQNDSVKNDTLRCNLKKDILANFDERRQLDVLEAASRRVSRRIRNTYSNSSKDRFRYETKKLNMFDMEFYNRISLSLSCMLLFFIGTPLGAIIKKGGMGMPMVSAIIIYVIYHFSNTMGKNMAEDNTLSSFSGAWVSTFLMLPLALFLTTRATSEKGIGNIKGLYSKISAFIKKRKK